MGLRGCDQSGPSPESLFCFFFGSQKEPFYSNVATSRVNNSSSACIVGGGAV
jgi:hypothetical protein